MPKTTGKFIKLCKTISDDSFLFSFQTTRAFLVQHLRWGFFAKKVPQLWKAFCFFTVMHILFYLTNQKRVLQKDIKDWTFVVY